jgi:hypothetical protein
MSTIVVRKHKYLQGRREGGGMGQNTWGPECSEGPGNLGKIFVWFIIALYVYPK